MGVAPGSARDRALRGGSWFFRADYYATGWQPKPWFLCRWRMELDNIGFRVVRDIER